MTFLIVLGFFCSLGLAVVLLAGLWSFWWDLSDGEFWGLGAWFGSVGLIIATAAQAAEWLL